MITGAGIVAIMHRRASTVGDTYVTDVHMIHTRPHRASTSGIDKPSVAFGSELAATLHGYSSYLHKWLLNVMSSDWFH